MDSKALARFFAQDDAPLIVNAFNALEGSPLRHALLSHAMALVNASKGEPITLEAVATNQRVEAPSGPSLPRPETKRTGHDWSPEMVARLLHLRVKSHYNFEKIADRLSQEFHAEPPFTAEAIKKAFYRNKKKGSLKDDKRIDPPDPPKEHHGELEPDPNWRETLHKGPLRAETLSGKIIELNQRGVPPSKIKIRLGGMGIHTDMDTIRRALSAAVAKGIEVPAARGNTRSGLITTPGRFGSVEERLQVDGKIIELRRGGMGYSSIASQINDSRVDKPYIAQVIYKAKQGGADLSPEQEPRGDITAADFMPATTRMGL